MQHMGRVVGLGVGVTHGCMLCTGPNTVAVCISVAFSCHCGSHAVVCAYVCRLWSVGSSHAGVPEAVRLSNAHM